MTTNPVSTFPFPARRGLLRDLLDGAALLAVWLLLWSWFALAVVRPLSRATPEPPVAAAARERA